MGTTRAVFAEGGITGALKLIAAVPPAVVLQLLISETNFAAFGAGLSARIPRLAMSQGIQFWVVAEFKAFYDARTN